MKKNWIKTSLASIACGMMLWGCAGMQTAPQPVEAPAPIRSIQDIDSFRTDVASQQALEVVNGNPYNQEFFEEVFAKLVAQCRNNTSSDNADLIWENFVAPLEQSGKVPPDLAKHLWNCYFSRQFVSLPDETTVGQSCYHLAEIKKGLEKEYQLKKIGFEVCRQGSPDSHFLNAMYVYNTMWAACNGAE